MFHKYPSVPPTGSGTGPAFCWRWTTRVARAVPGHHDRQGLNASAAESG